MGSPLVSGLANVIMTELEAKIDDQKLPVKYLSFIVDIDDTLLSITLSSLFIT